MEERTVAPGVIQVGLRSDTLPPFDRTWTTVVLANGRALLVDPGFSDPDDADRLLDRLRAHGMRDLAGVVLTHGHDDHVTGLPALLRATGAVPVRAHPLEIGRIPTQKVAPLQDGRTLMVAGRTVRAVHTPGHAPGHLVLVVDGEGVIGGDLATGSGAPWIGLPEGDADAYLDSLARVRALRPRWLALAHGPATPDADAALDAARDHRLARERSLLDARATPLTLEPLIVRTYGERYAPDGAASDRERHLVRASVSAQLLRLMRALRVVHLGEGEDGPFVRREGAR
ncbi:MAG: MBL fold metallo-hydrolase [Trueperaceae bacterium]